MKRIISVCLGVISLFVILKANQLTLDNFNVDDSGNIIASGSLSVAGVTSTDDVSITGDVTIDGLETRGVSSTVYLSTSSSLSITDSIMVICGTGTITSNATPFISTTTYTEGTHFMIVGGSNTVTLQDNGTKSGTLLELGSNTRALSSNDVLELLLINGKWIEIGFNNN